MIYRFGSRISKEQAGELIADTEPLLTPSLVQFGPTRRKSDLRCSDNHRWRKPHPVADNIRKIAAGLFDVSADSVEAVDVVRYKKGGYFQTHHDGKHREYTVCFALSGGYRGGRLVFPKLGESLKLKQGEAVGWDNDADGFHQCELITGGEKWVAVAWIRRADAKDIQRQERDTVHDPPNAGEVPGDPGET